MWYVIQTRCGFEDELAERLKRKLKAEECRECFSPVFEDVKRTGGESRISRRRLFPGYVLIDTEKPEEVYEALRTVNEFTRLLGSEKDPEEEKLFIPVSEEDRLFLQSILSDGVMRVSFVEKVKGTQTGRIIGPLARYGNHITKLEFRKRWAIVEAEIFGKRRKIKFGLWTDEDEKIPWIEARKKDTSIPAEYLLMETDIGIHPGDKVRDISGIYGDEIFLVEEVNPLQRTIRTKAMIFGELRPIRLSADQVEKIQE
ncbi:MAG: hypothetical protein K5697_16990 [Lachnospiraceae bacterium]|nr:hypothetical protein [Lachnospiraceae bacterium]